VWEAYNPSPSRGNCAIRWISICRTARDAGPDGKVASIAYRERLESMKLIEEFMVLANVAAAEALEKARRR
jgi:exoribonuclease R